MSEPSLSVARRIAEAASEFEEHQTGHSPKSVTVVLGEETLVITLHGALSLAEKTLAKSPEGAAQVQEFHRQLFTDSSDRLREEVKRITGVEVREAAAEVEPTTGTIVQIFLLDRAVPADSWSGNESGDQSPNTEVLRC
jgi:uncharacterized protein YbcI